MRDKLKSFWLKIWGFIKFVGGHVWKFVKSKEGRTLLVHIIIMAGKAIIHIFTGV